MRRMKFYTARLRPPYEWKILGARMGVISAGLALSGFLALFVLQNLGYAGVGVAACGLAVLSAWVGARWLTTMIPPKPGIALREGTQLGLLRDRVRNPEWTNNRQWPSPIASRVGNIVILKSGEAWVNYLMQGVNFSAHQGDSIEDCQKTNALLFGALSRMEFIGEVHAVGVKARVSAETLTRRCIDYVPQWAQHESTHYRAAAEGLNIFNNEYKTGKRKSFERPFWLSVQVGTVGMNWFEKLLDATGLASAAAGIDVQEVQDRERKVWQCLPREFAAVRSMPDDLDWMLERAALRGVTTPVMPARDRGNKIMTAGNRNFRDVSITTGHEADALADMFIESMVDASQGRAGKLRRIFRDGIVHRYRSLRREASIAVHTPGSRTPDFPDGFTGYQTMLTLASGPSLDGSAAINKMTGIVDGFHGLDADVSLRITFTPLPGDAAAKKLAKAQRRNDSDDAALSRSEFDAAEYATIDTELRGVYGHARSERMLANVHVTMAFADANQHALEHKVQKVIAEMDDDGFQLFRHVGAQKELWKTMLPCTSATPLINDTRLTQTPNLLGAVMPFRRQTLGDPHGWPIGVSLENSLGQVVYMDVLTATASGDGSILLFGEQGVGKSSLAAVVAGAYVDLAGEVWFIDPSGEMEVYASAFPGSVIVDLTESEVSLDLLKCLPPAEAASAWLDAWCPLLGVELNSDEYEYLATVIAPGYRAVHYSPLKTSPGLNSTREVFDHIASGSDKVAIRLRRSFNAIKDQPAASCLVDPIDLSTGAVRVLPAFDATNSRFVVFNTRQYLLRDGDTATATSSRLGTAVFTTIAALARAYFSRSHRPALFGLDEAHAMDAPIIKRNILADTNKQGRKRDVSVLVSTQTVQSLGSGLELFTRRGTFRQRAAENAIPALQQVHITPTPKAVLAMANDLSPAAPGSTKPEPGREGELFWFDGRRAGKMRTFLPFIAERRRLADTRPDKIIRLDEHRAQQRNIQHVG